MGKITAVCISKEKGTPKENIEKCEMIENFGLKDDAHAGSIRQVSLLSAERVKEAEKKLKESSGESAIKLTPGIFGENILAEGIDFKSYPLGTVFEIGECRLALTQIGKKCHSGCTVQNLTGKCIMP
ncbi:MAG: MOSC domain-containing protein, partial [Lachnospiraceae bacterium]|nr:MOSC domain-containing protein [Lachnospiraceae bacterium]